MATPNESFDELRRLLGSRSRISNRGDDPIYYLIFRPSEMVEVKERLRKAWRTLLIRDGWTLVEISLAERIQRFIQEHRRRELWLQYEHDHPFDYEALNRSIGEALNRENVITAWLEEKLSEAERNANGLVLVTDVEALHPYARIGPVEQSLQGRCPAPLVILYPGRRAGSTTLRFLDVYPEDGNYRSIHVGG